MNESALLITLTSSLAVALVLGFVTRKLGLSPIVGYLLAGLLVGPHTPGFIADRAVADQFAEVGVILLMFGVGLHFRLKDLLAVRNIAIIGALCQSAVATVLGAFVGWAFGLTWGASVIFGLALSVASTVMLTRVLDDNQHLQTRTGRIAIGWLVVEDIFTVVVLVLLPAIFSTSSTTVAPSLVAVVGITAARLILLVLSVFVIGGLLIPRVLNAVARTHSRELFTLTVLALALGIAVGSAAIFGVSMALGAFLAGMIVGQSEFSFRAASDALPMRDAFAVLFFVSMGMLLDPRTLITAPALLLSALAVILIGKPLTAFLVVAIFGLGSKVALGVAVALAQIGEFSLILMSVGSQLNILPVNVVNVIVVASVISLTLNPLFYRSAGAWEKALTRSPRLWRLLNPQRAPEFPAISESSGELRAIIVGYGPIGRTVARLLRDRDIRPVFIEMNLDLSRRVRADGMEVVYGEATHPEILEAAGIRTALVLVVSGPTPEQAVEIIRIARQINPYIRVLARTYYLRETATMRQAGADQVFSGEGEVALAMTEFVLELLGATPEQTDRERQRVREEVFQIGQPQSEGK